MTDERSSSNLEDESDMGTDSRTPSVRATAWTVILAIVAAVLLAEAIHVTGSGLFWPIVPLLVILIGGVAGGLVSTRWLDVAAVAFGGAIGIEIIAALNVIAGEAPNDIVVLSLFPASIVFGLLLAVAAAGFRIRQSTIGRRARLMRGALLALVIAGGWYVVFVHDDAVSVETYRVDGAQALVVEIAGVPHAWTRISRVDETPTQVRITARSLWMSTLGGAAYLQLVEVPIKLSQPLGDRDVVDEHGVPIRLDARQSTSPAGAPVVTITTGLHPRMTPEAVETDVLEQIRQMEAMVGSIARPARIVSVTATTAAGIAALEPGSGRRDPIPTGIQWLVRAEGTFTNNRTPPGASPMVARSGYFVVDDSDGGVLSFGFP